MNYYEFSHNEERKPIFAFCFLLHSLSRDKQAFFIMSVKFERIAAKFTLCINRSIHRFRVVEEMTVQIAVEFIRIFAAFSSVLSPIVRTVRSGTIALSDVASSPRRRKFGV